MEEPKKFLATIKKGTLIVNQAAAGAGVAGLLGFLGLFLIGSIFLVTENFFIAMFMVSLSLLVYVVGLDLAKVLLSSFTIFFSSKHLVTKAAYLQDTLEALKEVLKLHRNSKGEISSLPLEPGTKILLPDNPLVQEIRSVLNNKKSFDYAEFVAHSYYVECHELYDYANNSLEFVAQLMPLFGLIGTVVGLIGMFDTLGANVAVETLSPQLAIALKTTLYGAVFSAAYKTIASRFEQRIRALDYDYETFSRALEVIIQNQSLIEVES